MATMGEVYRALGLYPNGGSSDLPTRTSLTSSQEQLAELEFALGNYDQTESLARAALATREALSEGRAPEAGRALKMLASVAFSRSDYEQAAELFRRAVAALEARLGPATSILVGLGELSEREGDS